MGVEALRRLCGCQLLCCTEDHECTAGCSAERVLCLSCRFPLCRICQLAPHGLCVVPMGLGDDNWYGFLQEWIYGKRVTWMEKTVATPY